MPAAARAALRVERALFLNRFAAPLPGGFDRLYFGAEFCCWTFPPVAECRRALVAAHAAGWAFTLATPILHQHFLPRIEEIFAELLPAFTSGDEVLISDWGGLAPLRRAAPEATVILGRVLSGQKRGPQILDLVLNADELDYFRQGSWYAPEAVTLLQENAIARVELDLLLQGVAPLPAGLAGSLHYPYAMVTSSRNCPYRSSSSVAGCPAPCGEVFTLSSPASPLPLFQGGNTQFLRHEEPPAPPFPAGIDRTVFHPQLPR